MQSKFNKYIIRTLAVLFVIFMIAFGLNKFLAWQKNKDIDALVEIIEKAEREDYERALADTYGGKTPQETLRMYIEAVEAGDYELASKYVIEGNREENLKLLKNTDKSVLETYFDYLKTSQPFNSSLEEDSYLMEAKTDRGPSVLTRFRKYPNGIWKIIEI